jgi:hypothetical protein
VENSGPIFSVLSADHTRRGEPDEVVAGRHAKDRVNADIRTATPGNSSQRLPSPVGHDPDGVPVMTARTMSVLGSVFYLIWAALHVQAAYGVAQLGDSVPASMVQGRLYQDAWTLLTAAGAVAIVSLITLVRRWSLGYWLNLGIAGITDIGFIAFVLAPGYAPLWPGLQGPLAWILGLAFSTVGVILTKRMAVHRQDARAVVPGR